MKKKIKNWFKKLRFLKFIQKNEHTLNLIGLGFY